MFAVNGTAVKVIKMNCCYTVFLVHGILIFFVKNVIIYGQKYFGKIILTFRPCYLPV